MEHKEDIELKELNQPLNDNLPKTLEPLNKTLQHKNKKEDQPEGSVAGSLASDDKERPRRPSAKGPFRPIRNGTIRGSTFAFLTACIATGCLNLPEKVHQMGIIPFIILLFLTAAFSYYGMHLIQLFIFKYKVESYAEMVQRAFGQRATLWTNIILILFTWAVTTCYEVIFMRFGIQILNDTFRWPLYTDRDNEIISPTGQTARIIVGILMIVFNWGYFSMTDLNAVLHTAGKLSIIGTFFCVGVVYVTAIFGFHRDYNNQEIQFQSVLLMNFDNLEWFKPRSWHYFMVLLQGTAMMYFIYLNHTFVFPLISHLKRPTRKRAEEIFMWAHIQQFIIYGILGILGYCLLSQHLDILPISPLIIASIPTTLVMIGKITMTIALFYRLPLMLFLAKQFIYESLDIERNDVNLRKQNIVLCFSSLFVAIICQQINTYFALIGGIFGVAIGAAIPIACVFKLLHVTERLRWIILFCTVMSLIAMFGAIFSVFYPI